MGQQKNHNNTLNIRAGTKPRLNFFWRIMLYNEDCLTALKRVDDNSVDAIITDPPYGIDYAGQQGSSKRKFGKMAGDKKPFIWFLNDAYRITKDGGCLLCFCGWKTQDVFKTAIECAGYAIRSHIVWDKMWHGMGDLTAAFAPSHEIIWFATKGRYSFPSGRPKDVISLMRVANHRLFHPAEKPVPLLEYLISMTVPEGGTVADPFAGSGTTGVACVNTGRKFWGCEIDKRYYDIAIQRIAEAGQAQATRGGQGSSAYAQGPELSAEISGAAEANTKAP